MTKKLIVALIMFIGFVDAQASNLVNNGDFSQGATGWTIISPIHNYGLSAEGWFDGAYKNNPDTFSQAISTIAGDKYTLSYTFSTVTNQVGLIFKSIWNGTAIQTITTPNTTATTYTFTDLLATSNSTVLSFVSGNDPFYNRLQNISLTQQPSAVPVPAAIWMFATGLLGLGAMRKKVQA